MPRQRLHYTTGEAAAILGCSVSQVRRLCSSGRLQASKADGIGRGWRILRADIDALTRALQHRPLPSPQFTGYRRTGRRPAAGAALPDIPGSRRLGA